MLRGEVSQRLQTEVQLATAQASLAAAQESLASATALEQELAMSREEMAELMSVTQEEPLAMEP